MRSSQMFIPTLRDDPAQVEAASQRLLMRGGYIRQLTSGVYSLLPLGQRVRLRVIDIIREEMNNIGGQEFALSALQPLDLWEESGRKETVADIMFRLKDRKGSELALGLTHEEVFTSIARASLDSYKQVPQIWYQIQTKFRDELRPKGGLLRVREFTMKDSYSFDFDEAGLDKSFQAHYEAYKRIFTRCGLNFRTVEASSGAMGGSRSVEFMVLTPAGEDNLVLCKGCDYAANVEKAESAEDNESKVHSSNQEGEELEEFATPNVRTIKELEQFPQGAAAHCQIKTLVYSADGQLILALVRGDQELNEAKLQSVLQASTLRQATDSEIFDALGAHAGSLGACGVIAGSTQKIKRIFADQRLQGRSEMTTGANKDDFHLRNVSLKRDIKTDEFVDLHTVKAGEACIKCGGALNMERGLEIGHIFKLGTRYSQIMNATVIGANGARSPLVMGSYGIGVERLMAAVAEQTHDEQGLSWPSSIAPFDCLIVPVNINDQNIMNIAEQFYNELRAKNIAVLLDDRDERAGVKFNDADLIGVPYRITIGKKISTGQVELFERASKTKTDIPISELVQKILHYLQATKSTSNSQI